MGLGNTGLSLVLSSNSPGANEEGKIIWHESPFIARNQVHGCIGVCQQSHTPTPTPHPTPDTPSPAGSQRAPLRRLREVPAESRLLWLLLLFVSVSSGLSVSNVKRSDTNCNRKVAFPAQLTTTNSYTHHDPQKYIWQGMHY